MTSINNPEVAAAFQSYPPNLRRRLLALRELILETAARTQGVGEIEETLKWGEPAYVTSHSKSGSTVRIGPVKSNSKQYAMYFNCQTSLVETFRHWFANQLQFDGNRSVVFNDDDVVPREALAVCVATALTYHLNKKAQRR